MHAGLTRPIVSSSVRISSRCLAVNPVPTRPAYVSSPPIYDPRCNAPKPDVLPFRSVKEIRALCDAIELPCFVKTSGSTGLHVLVPLGRQCTYEQSKVLSQLLATVTAARIPDIATIQRALPSRQGRVYIDFVQNGHGKLLVSPLCVRPLPGAPVSMPLKWSEVNGKLEIGNFTIKNAPKRITRMKKDPMRDVLTEKPDLPAVLDRLTELVEASE